MKYSEAERKLKANGCYLHRSGGNHQIWFSPITNKYFPMSHHKSEKVKTGTLQNISNLAGVKL